jgi:hypothetical protein
MNIERIEKEFKAKVCDRIQLLPEGKERLIVSTPFTFEDGDHLCILLKKSEDRWYFTDEGHTFMHLSYDDLDVDKGTRRKIIDTVLGTYQIQNAEGELRCLVENGDFGDALFTFVQGIIKITDVAYLRRERLRSLFMEEFRSFLEESIPAERYTFNYRDPQHDPEGKYTVDCRINSRRRPLFLFGIPNDDKCRDVTITCLQFEKFEVPFISAAVFENQEEINRRVLARFSDVCERQFPSLQSAKERFDKYLANLPE